MSKTFSQPSAPRRGRRAPFVVLAAALVLAACGSSSGDSAGITVGSTEISTKEIDRELNAIAKNKVIASQAAVDGKIRPEVAESWLTSDVQIAVAKNAVKKAKKKPSSEDRAAALNWGNEHFGSEQAFNAFPDWFQAKVLLDYAFVPAYQRLHSKVPTEQEMRDTYTSSLTRNCQSGRYVFRILSPDQATVQAAAAQVAAGTDFSQVAKTVSTDAASKEQGGAIGCLDTQQRDATLTATANATPLGSVSPPFSTSEGWQIVKVEDIGKVLPYDQVKSEIRDTLQYGDEGRAALNQAVAKAKVKLDPRFGRWVVTGGQGHVVAPKSKSSRSTTTTSAPGEPSTTTATKP
jgi:parvulin-like peptidyl-prolyl isomerase